ncbi:histidine phosphatase family protein [Nocardioides marmotae]|uniref:histidine phosphatase family protein n=1 Tax=Nocardioides marmotae TaxID=2663857 RepID=UPI0012B58302|nr:histidine phosphatase family protein [Nocardioides marmotae]MBC9733122.1 histidine phosphatase family protein [Nocardioides marmotae]MTB84236.1 histidine phosphatase family protein [Nocardioides marmotae]
MRSAESGPRRLVLLRHGQTAYNAEKRIQGQHDVELDATGHAQAAAAAPYVAAYRPTRLVTSDLARARQTAAYVAKETGLDAEHDPRLREAMLGVRETMTHAEYAAQAPAEFAAFLAGDWDVVPGGEGLAALRARMTDALRDALAATPAGETTVAVSHGGAIKVGVASVLGWPDEAARTLRALRNCHWLVLEQRPGAGAEPGRVVLAAYGLTPISSSERL